MKQKLSRQSSSVFLLLSSVLMSVIRYFVFLKKSFISHYISDFVRGHIHVFFKIFAFWMLSCNLPTIAWILLLLQKCSEYKDTKVVHTRLTLRKILVKLRLFKSLRYFRWRRKNQNGLKIIGGRILCKNQNHRLRLILGHWTIQKLLTSLTFQQMRLIWLAEWKNCELICRKFGNKSGKCAATTF